MTKENKQAILDDSGLIEIRFSYNPNIITQIKQIPGRKWTPKSKTWTVPISQKAINQLTEFGFDIDEKIIKRLENNLLPQPNWDLLPGGLYDFQKEGVKFIEEHGGRALIAGYERFARPDVSFYGGNSDRSNTCHFKHLAAV